jgi:hypothetical protein
MNLQIVQMLQQLLAMQVASRFTCLLLQVASHSSASFLAALTAATTGHMAAAAGDNLLTASNNLVTAAGANLAAAGDKIAAMVEHTHLADGDDNSADDTAAAAARDQGRGSSVLLQGACVTDSVTNSVSNMMPMTGAMAPMTSGMVPVDGLDVKAAVMKPAGGGRPAAAAAAAAPAGAAQHQAVTVRLLQMQQ